MQRCTDLCRVQTQAVRLAAAQAEGEFALALGEVVVDIDQARIGCQLRLEQGGDFLQNREVIPLYFRLYGRVLGWTGLDDLDLDLLVAVAEAGGFGADEVSHALELDVHLGAVGYIDDQLREVGPHVGAIVGVEDSDIDQHSLD